MRKYPFILLAFFANFLALAQNNPPVVVIKSASVDVVNQKVELNYSLSDAQNHPSMVWLKYSKDGGVFYDTILSNNLSGDAGAGITNGPDKKIIWNYAGTSGNIYNTKLKLYASDGQTVSIADMVKQVDSNNLRRTLRSMQGVRNLGSSSILIGKVRDSIETIFNKYGFYTEKQTFSYNSLTGINITGRKPGMKGEDKTIVIDAHYDGVAGSPAADDNGSGVVGMMEAARILRQYNFEHSLRFIGFDFEEAGLIGSQRYVQSYIKSYEKLEGVLNLEMIGFYSNKKNSQTVPTGFNLLFPQAYQQLVNDTFKGNFIVVCGNTNSATLNSAYVKSTNLYVPQLKMLSVEVPSNGQIAPDFRRSDHASFWDNNNKALMLTDGSNFRNNNYHKPSDSIGTLNFNFMTNVVKATLATAAALCKPISAGYAEIDLATVSSIDKHAHDLPVLIEIYPNPSNGKMILEYSTHEKLSSRVEVFDLTGKVVWQKVIDFNKSKEKLPLDLSGLHSGTYLILFTTGDKSLTKSIIIE